ncbi:hypothetical protein RQP46_005043 [Phenoliferia psychrophenolica]
MLTDGTHLPRLPTETWIQILTEHGLSYPDLKRIARVSKGMHVFIQSTAFDALLFRGGVPLGDTLPAGTNATLHPALVHGSDFVQIDTPSFLIPHPHTADARTWSISELACRYEHATSPSVTELRISNLMLERRAFYLTNPGGVTVIDVLKSIAQRWRSPPHDDGPTGSYDRLGTNFERAMHDGTYWTGWRKLFVNKEGTLTLRRHELV